jgi:hypothetical protein
MPKYTISISGYGCELTIGTVTNVEKNTINKLLENTEDSYLEDIIQDHESIRKDWHELDDIYHNFGASDNFTLMVYKDDNLIHELESDKLFEDYYDNIDFNYIDIDESKDIIISVNHEKGLFFEGSLETNDEFDLSKLTVEIDDEIGVGEYYYGSIISKIKYNGEEIENHGGSTSGKSFESYKNF